MSDSVKKWFEMQEELNEPIIPIKKKKLYDAFIYNLNCYDAKIIDREDFINAMEDYIYG